MIFSDLNSCPSHSPSPGLFCAVTGLKQEHDWSFAHPQVSWGCWRTPAGLSKGMPGGDQVVFSVQSLDTCGKIRGFQLKILFSVSEWTQLSPLLNSAVSSVHSELISFLLSWQQVCWAGLGAVSSLQLSSGDWPQSGTVEARHADIFMGLRGFISKPSWG